MALADCDKAMTSKSQVYSGDPGETEESGSSNYCVGKKIVGGKDRSREIS